MNFILYLFAYWFDSGQVKKGGKKRGKQPESSKRARRNDSDDDSVPSDPQDEEYCPERESPSEDDVAFVNEAFEDVVIDINAYTARPRQWTAADFSKARAPYAYDLENDTNNLYFHTKVQEDAFFGHLVDKNVFKHQTIDFGFMSSQPTMSDVVTML